MSEVREDGFRVPELERVLARARRRLLRATFTRTAGPLVATALIAIAACSLRRQFSVVDENELRLFAGLVLPAALGLAIILTWLDRPDRRRAARALDEWNEAPSSALTYVDRAAHASPTALDRLFRDRLRRDAASFSLPSSPRPGPFAVRVLVPLVAVNALLAVMPPSTPPSSDELRAARDLIQRTGRVRTPEDRVLEKATRDLAEARDRDELARRAREIYRANTPERTRNDDAPARSADPARDLTRALDAGRPTEARDAARRLADKSAAEDEQDLARVLEDAARRASSRDAEELTRLALDLRRRSGTGGRGDFGLGRLAAERARQKRREREETQRVRDLALRVLDRLGERPTPSANEGAGPAEENQDQPNEGTSDPGGDALQRRRLLRLPPELREAGRLFLQRRKRRDA